MFRRLGFEIFKPEADLGIHPPQHLVPGPFRWVQNRLSVLLRFEGWRPIMEKPTRRFQSWKSRGNQKMLPATRQ